MTARSLYLDSACRWRVHLDDGVALSVLTEGRARSRVPLTWIARVVSPTSAQWDTSALMACLRAGIPVIFHDGRGDPVGWCFGSRRRETTLTTLLREGLGQSDWDSRFECWRQACARREMLDFLRRAGHGCANLEPSTVRTVACNLLRERTGRAVGEHVGALHRGAAALVAGHLQDALGDCTLIGHPRPGLHWGLVFLELLEWAMHGVLLDMSPDMVREMSPERLAAHVLELHGGPLHSALGRLLGDLELYLREWLWQPMP